MIGQRDKRITLPGYDGRHSRISSDGNALQERNGNSGPSLTVEFPKACRPHRPTNHSRRNPSGFFGKAPKRSPTTSTGYFLRTLLFGLQDPDTGEQSIRRIGQKLESDLNAANPWLLTLNEHHMR
jgi:hypothetical protein